MNKDNKDKLNSVFRECWCDGVDKKICCLHLQNTHLTQGKVISYCCCCCQDHGMLLWALLKHSPGFVLQMLEVLTRDLNTRRCQLQELLDGGQTCLKCILDSPVSKPLSGIAPFPFFLHLSSHWMTLLWDEYMWMVQRTVAYLSRSLGIAARHKVIFRHSKEH